LDFNFHLHEDLIQIRRSGKFHSYDGRFNPNWQTLFANFCRKWTSISKSYSPK